MDGVCLSIYVMENVPYCFPDASARPGTHSVYPLSRSIFSLIVIPTSLVLTVSLTTASLYYPVHHRMVVF